MNDVPGSQQLGWGFNILGPYADTSLKSQLFTVAGGREWTDPISGTEYILPNNVSLDPDERVSGETATFNTRTKVQEFFSAKAGLSGTVVTEYGAFSGSFKSAYQINTSEETSYQYGVFEADYRAYEIGLASQAVHNLTPDAQQQIDALPTTFSPSTQAAFFAFFDRYGTHYVSQVTVGGRLYYWVAVEKSYTTSDSTIRADIELEYNAVLVSSTAKAETEWRQLGESWAESRKVHVEALGGDPGVLLLAAPEYGDSRSGIYESWVNSIKTAPATIDMTLRPISMLLSGACAEAMATAMQAYLSDNLLIVEARSEDLPYPPPAPPPVNVPQIFLQEPIRPLTPALHDFGFQVVVLKHQQDDNFVIDLNEYFGTDLYGSDTPDYAKVYDQMEQALQAGGYLEPGYVLVVASYNWNWQAPPTSSFYGILRSAGGGPLLESWFDGVISPGSINQQDCTYVLVGDTGSGPNQGAEALDKAPIGGGPLTTSVAVRLKAGGIQRVNTLSLDAAIERSRTRSEDVRVAS